MTQERPDSKRLTDEIRYVGGEKTLDDLSPTDRQVWNRQSLVLSHLREHGDVSEASVKAGVPITLTHEWRFDDVLGYSTRHDQARADLGRRVLREITAQVLQGKIKNAPILNLVLADLLPEEYGERVGVTPDNPLDALRDVAERHQREQMAADAVREAEKLVKGETNDDDSSFAID